MFNPKETPVFTNEAWKRLVDRDLLLPDVKNLEVYQARFQSGLQELGLRIYNRPTHYFMTGECLKEVHGGLFSGCHKEAGVFRTRHVIAGKSMPADFGRIEEEMVLREVQTAILAKSHDVDSLITAAAFSHVRAKAIQPFLDGNKRSSRVQASFLLYSRIQTFPSWGTQPEYADAMGRAHDEDLTNLVNILRRSLGYAESASPILSPFRIRPFLKGDGIYDPSYSIDELLELSRKTKRSPTR
jgi:fido (protein-threonine AMPylation protein)